MYRPLLKTKGKTRNGLSFKNKNSQKLCLRLNKGYFVNIYVIKHKRGFL
jgi:hypothetical protein